MRSRSSDIYADVAARADCFSYYGEQKWYAGHRNGASGLANPNTDDINSKSPSWRCEDLTTAHPRSAYKNAIYWIRTQIESDSRYRTDDTRFWVDVTPI